MTELHKDIKSWLHKQAEWLQQAAELILVKGTLDDADIKTIADRLKTPEGQQPTNTRQFSELGAANVQAHEVRLKSIGEIVGIENLGPRMPLEFGTGNLCVIYGNNGSGKSGYTRLLKRAAGKPRAMELKHNVFQQVPVHRKARVTFIHGAAENSRDWLANGAAINELQAVDFFDTDTAINYLSRDNEAAYTPPLVSLFEQLVGVANRVRERLQAQQAALQKALPQLPQEFLNTVSGKLYGNLKANSTTSDVQKIKAWTDAEERELTQLVQRLTATDPAAQARSKRATKAQIQQIETQIKTTANAYSDEALKAARSMRDDAREKRKVAQEAAQIQSAKLDGIGSETWKALWEAARSYSQTAYPQRDFPVVDDAHCLLCHQELVGDAKQRLKDFEKFVQGNVEQAAVAAEQECKTTLANFPDALDEKVVVQAYQSAGLNDEALLAGIQQFWKDVAASREVIQEGGDGVVVLLPQAIVGALESQANSLEEQSKQHDQDAANFDRAATIQQKLELEAKKWTAQQAVAIDTEMQRLKQSAEFDGWLKLTNTQQITLKGGQVAETAITEAYVARFNKELEALKARRIKVKLVKTKAALGKAYHGLQLEGSVDGGAKLDEILSEGERRIISLAAFLADVSEKPNASAFIFDDPISSLDQDFELAVAARLVKLAQTRQVLVFTHRLSFYGALDDAARKFGEDWRSKHFERLCIESDLFAKVSGVQVEIPIWASKTDTANNTLFNRLDKARKEGEQSGAQAYRNLAQGICSDFRKLIERTIEFDLFGDVIARHRKEVQTQKLPKIFPLQKPDIDLLDGLMTKYSAFEHSQSLEAPVDLPDEADLRADLEKLKNWRDTFRKRQPLGAVDA